MLCRVFASERSAVQAVFLTLHVFDDDVVNVAQARAVFEHLPGRVRVEVDLDEILVANGQQAVARDVALDIPHIANIENITDSEIEEIQAWANAQYERASEIADIDTLPDVISFGETIVIKGVDGGKASLSIGDNQISPDEGSEEVIDICFSNGDENTTSGYIKLTVGYLNFDEDGGAADGISDEVEYEYHDILKELDNFIYAQNCLIEKDTRIAEIISEAIKTNGDNT